MTEEEYLEALEAEKYRVWAESQETGSDTSQEAYADYLVGMAEDWIDRESGKWGVRS